MNYQINEIKVSKTHDRKDVQRTCLFYAPMYQKETHPLIPKKLRNFVQSLLSVENVTGIGALSFINELALQPFL